MTTSARRKMSTSPIFSGDARKPLKPTPEALDFLAPYLPRGWARYFSARRAGRYWGLSIRCPHCQATPPREMKYGSRRWRWLSVHMAEEHTR